MHISQCLKHIVESKLVNLPGVKLMKGLGTYTNFGKPGEDRLWLDCMISP